MNIDQLYTIYKTNNSICTDTRKLENGDMYFALKGDNFDGNAFTEKALQKGASFCIVDDKKLKNKSNKIIIVDDVLKTLQQLAKYHRASFKFPIIALTGSNGKTTTKELIQAVLTSTYKVRATKGNLNNHIGVPLTLLSFTNDLDFGIVEMGANHQKEIEFLCRIAQPDYALITNFGKAHLEGFGSIEGVIKGKSEIYNHLINNSKTIFINSDDSTQIQQIGNYKNIITFGSKQTVDYVINFESANPFVHLSYDTTKIESQLIGNYNFDNIAIATAIGSYFNVTTKNIKKAIENYQPDNNRSEIIDSDTNKIILDAYNANPTSMLAALNNFKQLQVENKYLFIGDMFELGKDAKKEHQAIVDFIETNFTDNIYLVGENFYKTKTKKTTNKFLTFNDLKTQLQIASIKNATILIKGSRGMALERILESL